MCTHTFCFAAEVSTEVRVCVSVCVCMCVCVCLCVSAYEYVLSYAHIQYVFVVNSRAKYIYLRRIMSLYRICTCSPICGPTYRRPY